MVTEVLGGHFGSLWLGAPYMYDSNYVYNIIFSQIHPGESATLGDWEMTHSDLELQGDLGKGQFRDVKLANLKTMTCTRRVRNYMDRMINLGNSMSTSNTVAVKYLKGNYNSSL